MKGILMHIFIGNLPPEFTDDNLRALFEPFGEVRTAMVSINKKTNLPEGYGIVEMAGKADSRKAVDELKGTEVSGHKLTVKIIKPNDPFHPSPQAGFRTGSIMRPSGGGFSAGGGVKRHGGQRGS